MRSRRMMAPTRVTRLSLAAAQTGLPSFSASLRMLRNLAIWKVVPLAPTRSCRYSTVPGLSSLMSTAVTSMIGAASTSSSEAQNRSNTRLMSVRAVPWLKPSPKISQLALR